MPTLPVTRAELDELRREMMATRAEIASRKRTKDRHFRPGEMISVRVGPECLARVKAEAKRRNLSLSAMMRLALDVVVKFQSEDAFAETAPQPRFTARHKTDHFGDGRTDTIERDRARAREAAGKAVAERTRLIAADAASVSAGRIADGMLAEPPLQKTLGSKLSR